MSDAIVAEGLVKRFAGVPALDGVDLTVPEGTVLGLLGPNGAGKTTTVRVLTTLLRPDGGYAEVAGIDVSKNPAAVRRRIGLAGQFAAVDYVLTGRENLVLFGRLYRLGRRQAEKRADRLLESFGLTEVGNNPVKTYSGGMARRLDLASALVATPHVLFMDEPSVGLDPGARLELWDLLEELVRGGMTLLLTTQYLEEAERLADAIAVVDKGKVIARGTVDELKAQVGGDRVDVRIADPTQLSAAADALRGLAHGEPVVDLAGSVVGVPAAEGPSAIAEVVRALDRVGVGMLDISIHRPTLDDVFLHLTGASTAIAFAPAGAVADAVAPGVDDGAPAVESVAPAVESVAPAVSVAPVASAAPVASDAPVASGAGSVVQPVPAESPRAAARRARAHAGPPADETAVPAAEPAAAPTEGTEAWRSLAAHTGVLRPSAPPAMLASGTEPAPVAPDATQVRRPAEAAAHPRHASDPSVQPVAASEASVPPAAPAVPEPVAVAVPEPVAVAVPEPVAVAVPEPVADAEPAPDPWRAVAENLLARHAEASETRDHQAPAAYNGGAQEPAEAPTQLWPVPPARRRAPEPDVTEHWFRTGETPAVGVPSEERRPDPDFVPSHRVRRDVAFDPDAWFRPSDGAARSADEPAGNEPAGNWSAGNGSAAHGSAADGGYDPDATDPLGTPRVPVEPVAVDPTPGPGRRRRPANDSRAGRR